MTDKEKFCNKRCCCNPCKRICEYAQVYLEGLAEGRKENEGLKTANEHQALVIKQKDDLILKMKAQIEKMESDIEYWKEEYYYLKANPEEA